jgi:hypothetical protein
LHGSDRSWQRRSSAAGEVIGYRRHLGLGSVLTLRQLRDVEGLPDPALRHCHVCLHRRDPQIPSC